MEILETHEWRPTEPDPQAPVAVLVHGVTGWHRTWWRVGPALAERGWRVVAVDQRGHGRSPRISGAVTIDDAAEDHRFRVENRWIPENDPSWDRPAMLTLDVVLPDVEPPLSWRDATEDQERQWICSKLVALGRNRRRAFALNALDGWDPEEIAIVQERSTDEVRADIEEAREALTRALVAHDAKPPKPEPAPVGPPSLDR